MKNEILNFNFGAIAQTTIATMYFGLSTTLVTVAGLASSTEPATANGYARVAFTNNQSTHWHNSTASSIHNDETVAFPQSTDSWGTILSLFISESGTRAAGDIWWYCTLSPSIAVPNLTTVTFAIGSIIFTAA